MKMLLAGLLLMSSGILSALPASYGSLYMGLQQNKEFQSIVESEFDANSINVTLISRQIAMSNNDICPADLNDKVLSRSGSVLEVEFGYRPMVFKIENLEETKSLNKIYFVTDQSPSSLEICKTQ